MDENSVGAEQQARERLIEIKAELNSSQPDICRAALVKLAQLNRSDLQILRSLENIVLTTPDETLRVSATQALNWPLNRAVRQAATRWSVEQRQMILGEIAGWQNDYLMGPDYAGILSRHYDFDLIPPSMPPVPPQPQAMPQPLPLPLPVTVQPQPVLPAPLQIAYLPDRAAHVPPAAVGPRPTLIQTLLSETSIKIYLYLGAFFVIAAAIILAALVAALRLPILLTTTALFGVTAVGIRKRLPLPSFVLFIVFSCLVPISASVIGSQLALSIEGFLAYYLGVSLLLAALWGASTWFYQSRLFSLLAFGAWVAACCLIPSNFQARIPLAYNGLAVSFALLLTLPVVQILNRWRGKRFGLPLFIALQWVQMSLLGMALVLVLLESLLSNVPSVWAPLGCTCLLAALTYALSYWLFPKAFFPWVSAGCLLPVPYLFGVALHLNPDLLVALHWGWGMLLAAGGEMLRTTKNFGRAFSLPLALAALPVLAGMLLFRPLGDIVWLLCAAGTAAAFTWLQFRQARFWVWSVALLSALSAYYALLNLLAWALAPALNLAIAALLALLPDLWVRAGWNDDKPWRWPAWVLGLLLGICAIVFVLQDFTTSPDNAALVFGAFTLCAFAYAVRRNIIGLQYGFAILGVWTAAALLTFFEEVFWVGPLTGLASAYFAAGMALRRNSPSWSVSLRFSGLGLGLLLIIASFLLPTRLNIFAQGWFFAAIAALWMIETYQPNRRWFELAVYPIAILAAYLLLVTNSIRDWNVQGWVILLAVMGLDQVFERTRPNPRPWRFLLHVGSISLCVFNTSRLIMTPGKEVSLLFFAAYAALYLVLAFLEHRPQIGYAATAFAGMFLYYALLQGGIADWYLYLSGLAVVYYAAGYGLKRTDHAGGWAGMLRFSGLVLGAGVALRGLAYTGWSAPVSALIASALIGIELIHQRAAAFEIALDGGLILAYCLSMRELRAGEPVVYLFGASLIVPSVELFVRDFLKIKRVWNNFPLYFGLYGALGDSYLVLAHPSPLIAGALVMGVFASYALAYALFVKRPKYGYAVTVWIPLAVLSFLRTTFPLRWLFPLIGIAVAYYALGLALKRLRRGPEWATVLFFSGIGLAALTAISAPYENSGLQASIPVAIAATLFASEAFQRRNVWLGFPTNALYLMAYFMILFALKVDQPQFFSVGAALLGLLMHYLLVRAGSYTGALITGFVSQLVLLSTSYIQMAATNNLNFFVALFVQALVVLTYGVIIRSRSLVIAPIIFVVVGVVTVVFSVLKGMSTVLLIGCTGVLMLILGIAAVLMRERLIKVTGIISERIGGWRA